MISYSRWLFSSISPPMSGAWHGRISAAVDDVDRDIGVEADHSSKKTRGSGSAGGSSGMPSGRKSLPPSSSRRDAAAREHSGEAIASSSGQS